MTKKEIVESILSTMKDTQDPVDGAVFEKEVETDFATFCAFILTQYENVTMETKVGDGHTCHLFYNGPGATDHIATYIINPSWKKPHGVFGGSRIGSKNPWLNPGDPAVKNPFKERL